MDGSQNTLAVINMSVALTYPHIGEAVRAAGWDLRAVTGDDDDAVAAASMIVMDGTDQPISSRHDAIVAAVMENAGTPSFPVDLIVDPGLDVGALAAMFSQWRVPDMASLTRMATMLGRDGLMPVVRGLRAELEQAIGGAGGHSAHRIAGLAGTLGFTAAGAAWQAVDLGTGERTAALRDSRTAMVAIDRWLAEAG